MTQVRKIKEIFMFLKGTLENSHDASGTLKGNVLFLREKVTENSTKNRICLDENENLFPSHI